MTITNAASLAKHEGMLSAAEHAESVTQGWRTHAYRYLESYARANPSTPFTSEDVRKQCAGTVLDNGVPKAWGHVFLRAARNGVIRKKGYAPSRERHTSPTVLWESV